MHDAGDAMRDDAGLAAPGAGQDQQRPFRVGDGFALRGVQSLQKIHDPLNAGNSYDSSVGQADSLPDSQATGLRHTLILKTWTR